MKSQQFLDNLSQEELSLRFKNVIDESNKLTNFEKLLIKSNTEYLKVYPVSENGNEYLEYHAINHKDEEIYVIEEYIDIA